MNAGLDLDTLGMTLKAVKEFAAETLPEPLLLELDAKDEFPADIVRDMLAELGILLLFLGTVRGGWEIAGRPVLSGNLSSSELLGLVPMADP